jgi:CRP-like cAMP-binding protein
MDKHSAKVSDPHRSGTRKLLIAAQLLTLAAFALALQFLNRTTGGTLFLFSTIAPLLVMIGVAALIIVIVSEFRRRHSLFDFETYEPGQYIVHQGDEGDRAYFINSGEVEVIREDHETESVVAKLKPGQYFGETALIRNEPRNASVRAATNVRLAVLGKRNFLVMLSVMPSTQDDILKTVQQRAMAQGAK